MDLLMTVLTIFLLGTWIAVAAALGLAILARLVHIVVREFMDIRH